MDSDTLQRLVSGDRESFAGLVRDHHRALIALVVPMVGPVDAEEVVQNAWVKAHQAIASFEGRAQIRTWLGSIAINEARMLLRQRGRHLLAEDLFPGDDHRDPWEGQFLDDGHWRAGPHAWNIDSPENLLMQADLEQCLEKLLANMPANQRLVLEMRDSAELSFEEICNELALSASNVRVLLHRARSQLFRLVDHYEETGEC